MIQKKVCMLGAFAAGKTSLVSRYVRNTFSEKYLTTVGVRIERTTVRAGSHELDLILWDLHGEDEFQRLRASYLRGASGCILVVDRTRISTLDTAIRLRQDVTAALGDVPCLYVINKSDLEAESAVEDHALTDLRKSGSVVIATWFERWWAPRWLTSPARLPSSSSTPSDSTALRRTWRCRPMVVSSGGEGMSRRTDSRGSSAAASPRTRSSSSKACCRPSGATSVSRA
jgi:small GTP-binding protein